MASDLKGRINQSTKLFENYDIYNENASESK